MDAAGLIRSFRQRADDANAPYLYSDEDLLRWASEAEIEACTRARLIYDDTSGFLAIAVTAGTSVYALDSRIDRIGRASFTPASGTRACDLCLRGIDWIHDRTGWSTRRGRPSVAAYHERRLTLWPEPIEDGTLKLGVYRFPLWPMENDADEPEIPPEYHTDLVWWMLFLAYVTKDGDTEDSPRAALAAGQFQARFGERPSADVLRRHRERRRVTTRMAF